MKARSSQLSWFGLKSQLRCPRLKVELISTGLKFVMIWLSRRTSQVALGQRLSQVDRTISWAKSAHVESPVDLRRRLSRFDINWRSSWFDQTKGHDESAISKIDTSKSGRRLNQVCSGQVSPGQRSSWVNLYWRPSWDKGQRPVMKGRIESSKYFWNTNFLKN